VELLAIV